MTDHHPTPAGTSPTTAKTIATEVLLPGIVEPDGLQVRTRPLPSPGPGQVVVAVEASGVSFAEQQMRLGTYYDQPPFPFVPGYDLVGTVTATGPDADPELLGSRVAALTKTGGWASAVLLDAADLVPVPAGVDPAEAETLVVSGITAWQMLHRKARVRAGQTVLVHGANGSVGSNLVQLARHAGVRVIGTAAPRHHGAVRALGAEPLDYHDPDLPARVRELAPGGVDAVFDHLGGDGIVDSWRLLAPGGTLVSYGSASSKGDAGGAKLPVLKLVARLAAWNLAPNGKHASFYNVWAGLRRRARFHARLREDLSQVFALLADGTLTAQVAARLPLDQAAEAVRLAESRTVVGKVVLIATPHPLTRPAGERASTSPATSATGQDAGEKMMSDHKGLGVDETAAPPSGNPCIPCGGMAIDAGAPVISRGDIWIEAPLRTVWDLQVDVEAWPSWQPLVTAARRLDAGPLRPGSQFRWSTEGLTVTSTVSAVEQDSCLLWGGPASGIEGHHLWTFTEVEGGVLVHTEESWSGPPVEADTSHAQALLDASLEHWRNNLKTAAEARHTPA